MKAIILAAGRGSRMKNLTDDQPKCLLKVKGKTVLESQLQALRASGIIEISIVTGYKREKLSNYNLVEFHNPRWADTNMVYSLCCADTWLSTEPCIVSYSDIFYNFTAVSSLMTSQHELALTYDPNWLNLWKSRFDDPLTDAETFKINPDGELTEIGNTPRTLDEIEGQFMGLIKFTPKSWSILKKVRSNLVTNISEKMHMTNTLQLLIETKQIKIKAVPYSGIWGEIDSETDLMVYENGV